MPTLDDVARLALALPQTTEGTSWGNRSWKVKGKLFVWERPLNGSDLRWYDEQGETPPEGAILGVAVEHLGARDALLADDPAVCFTIPHLDGRPVVLVRLDAVAGDELAELVEEAWLARAPAALAATHLGDR